LALSALFAPTVVIGPKIELHEEPGAMEFIEELLHNRILGIYL
jgi:hypothetical protein